MVRPTPCFSLIPAVAALTGAATAEARSLLEALASVHLLERGESDRYQFHDLLRDYAAERAAADDPARDCEDAIRRLLTWYVRVAGAAQPMLIERQDSKDNADQTRLEVPFSTPSGALAWCDAELANLVAATRLAAAAGEDVIAWQLPAELRSFFLLRMPFAEWTAACEIGLAAARRLNDRSGEARILSGLAIAYHYLGRFEDAQSLLLQSLAINRQIGSREAEAMTLCNLGGTHASMARCEEAIGYLQ